MFLLTMCVNPASLIHMYTYAILVCEAFLRSFENTDSNREPSPESVPFLHSEPDFVMKKSDFSFSRKFVTCSRKCDEITKNKNLSLTGQCYERVLYLWCCSKSKYWTAFL